MYDLSKVEKERECAVVDGDSKQGGIEGWVNFESVYSKGIKRLRFNAHSQKFTNSHPTLYTISSI